MSEETKGEAQAQAAELQAEVDPASVIPLEAARAHLRHWWREPLSGLIAVSIGSFDAWKFGKEGGLTSSLDEILIIGGIILMAGSKRLFTMGPAMLEKEERKVVLPPKS